ncbi:MAG TPA: S41 family peptidase, partial [Chthoniobacterales bacterium]|nr:S41 family peptidase [Chthoniobacterales bacterium]
MPAAPPTSESLINAMGSADLDQAIQALRSNYINPDALSETEIDRATLAGLLTRLGRGVMLLPQQSAPAADTTTSFFAEILAGHIGYARIGSLTAPNLQAFDANLQSFGGKKVDALVVDLRATSTPNDFALASELTKRLCPKGKPLFTLRKPGQKQERAFTSDRDPAYGGLVIVLADADTSGPAEAVAGILRHHTKALVIGQPTAGRAVEFSDVNLNGGRMLRIAVAEAVLPDGRSLFPDGVKPDLPVEFSAVEKRQVFGESVTKGMSQFVFEAERPHMNEAALLAGR